MKTLEEILDEYAYLMTGEDWEAWVTEDYEIDSGDIREIAKRYAIEVAHIIVNDALRKHGIGSNTSAEFVNNWVESNLPKHQRL